MMAKAALLCHDVQFFSEFLPIPFLRSNCCPSRPPQNPRLIKSHLEATPRGIDDRRPSDCNFVHFRVHVASLRIMHCERQQQQEMYLENTVLLRQPLLSSFRRHAIFFHFSPSFISVIFFSFLFSRSVKNHGSSNNPFFFCLKIAQSVARTPCVCERRWRRSTW